MQVSMCKNTVLRTCAAESCVGANINSSCCNKLCLSVVFRAATVENGHSRVIQPMGTHRCSVPATFPSFPTAPCPAPSPMSGAVDTSGISAQRRVRHLGMQSIGETQLLAQHRWTRGENTICAMVSPVS